MTDFALARRNMVEGQLRPNRVTNAALLAALNELPRESFLPESRRSVAYADDDVPLGNGRYMMEPMVLARLIQSLQPQATDKALVVAAGRGYGAALLSRLAASVVAVEGDREMAADARRVLRELGAADVQVVTGPPEQGAANAGPFDVILIEGAIKEVPAAITTQLAEGGRLATVIAGVAASLGVAELFVKQGGITSGRPLFDAGTPVLPGFSPAPGFTF